MGWSSVQVMYILLLCPGEQEPVVGDVNVPQADETVVDGEQEPCVEGSLQVS